MFTKKALLGAAAGLIVASAVAIPTFAAGPATGPTDSTSCVGSGPQGSGGRWQGAFAIDDTVARLTKLTEDEIHAQRLAGKSLAQIALAKGVSEDTLIAEALKDRQAALTKLVQAGKLTQAQADQMLVNMKASIKTAVERTTTGPMGSGMQPGAGGRGQQGNQRGPGMGPGAR